MAGCRDGEWVVRYAVAVGLESLAPAVVAAPTQLQRLDLALTGLSQNLAEEAPVVRLRAEQARLRVQQLEPGRG